MNAVKCISDHILNLIAHERPLSVALQGPQGSGKSFLSARVKSHLETLPNRLRVAVLSIDDLYLPNVALKSLANAHPENILWRGRGHPGTHDVPLGMNILSALKSGQGNVELPRFDKSLCSGEGDRMPMDGSGIIVTQPPSLDVVIFEGWCVGFNHISEGDLHQKWRGVWQTEREKLGLEDHVGNLKDLKAVNEKLKDYSELWDLFDVFVQLKPLPPVSKSSSQYSIVYKWRLEQEHHMKAQNGGRGMSDEQVRSFVDRYVPGYILFGDMPSSTGEEDSAVPHKWSRRGLRLFLDEARQVVHTVHF